MNGIDIELHAKDRRVEGGGEIFPSVMVVGGTAVPDL
jgi:hypothetical protein